MAKTKNLVEKAIEKKFGNVFFDVDDLLDQRGHIIPTTLSLDIALKGGILDGTITFLAGKEASCKTTLCLTIAANAQKLGKKIYFMDIEGRLQPELLKTIPGLSLDPDKFQIIKSSKDKFLTAEDYYNILDSIVKTESNILGIIDSVASLCDSSAYSSEHGESKQMMSLPKLAYAECRKLVQILPSQKSSIIAITHLQANPSPYGPGYSLVGGNAWKFFASNTLVCLSSSEYPKTGEKEGRQSTFKVLKSALGPGTGEADFYIKYNRGYFKEKDIIILAKDLGLIEAGGAWLTFTSSNNEEVKVQGEEAMVTWLQSNPEEANILSTKIYDMLLTKT